MPNDSGKAATKYVVGGDKGIGSAPYRPGKDICSTNNRYIPTNIRTTASRPYNILFKDNMINYLG